MGSDQKLIKTGAIVFFVVGAIEAIAWVYMLVSFDINLLGLLTALFYFFSAFCAYNAHHSSTYLYALLGCELIILLCLGIDTVIEIVEFFFENLFSDATDESIFWSFITIVYSCAVLLFVIVLTIATVRYRKNN